MSKKTGTGSDNLTVAEVAKEIIAESKYPEDFLEIIPKDLQQKQVRPELVEDIDDEIHDIHNVCHQNQPQQSEFLLALANKIYF
jgi:hypothetical protein